MKNLKHLPSMLSIVFVLAACNALVLGQASEDKLANVNNLGSSVRFDVSAPHASVTLTVIGPEGVAFTKEFKSGNAPEFKLNTGKGERLPDGLYTWELRVAPNISDETKRALKEAREKDNAAEVQRELRKRGALPSTSLVQSGSFLIAGGSVILPGAVEERSAQARPALPLTRFVSAATAKSAYALPPPCSTFTLTPATRPRCDSNKTTRAASRHKRGTSPATQQTSSCAT